VTGSSAVTSGSVAFEDSVAVSVSSAMNTGSVASEPAGVVSVSRAGISC
jgi:hypothetical protein